MNKEHIPLESVLPAAQNSVYKLSILVAKRAMQLSDGAKALIDDPGEKVLATALQEIAEGKVRMREGVPKEDTPEEDSEE